MGVDRFYCPGFELDRPIHLVGDEARHLARVRRVGVGAEVEIFDGAGHVATAAVVAVGRDRVELLPRVRLLGLPAAPLELTLGTAIPKGDRFDWLIEKATELGVARVVPLMTERSTVDPRSAKLDRLRRAIVEACKQSRRDTLMQLDEPLAWNRWLDRHAALRWVAHPSGDRSWTRTQVEVGSAVAVAIGPEGGFSDAELAEAEAAGWSSISLTTTILRVETAGLALAARVLMGENPSR